MRISALIKRIFQEMLRDKRTLALLFVAPLLILSLMYLIFNGDTVEKRLGYSQLDEVIIEKLEDADIQLIEYRSSVSIGQTIVTDDLDGFLSMENQNVSLSLQNSDPTTAKQLQMTVNQVISAYMQSKLINMEMPLQEDLMEINYIYGDSETEFFDILSPILIGFFVFFFVFLISGIGFLKERTTGTLDKLMSTPIRRWEILIAYLAGYGVFAVIQTIIVITYAVTVLDVVLIGSVWHVLLINLILALVALSLGTLLSAFASSEFQMVQFIPIVIVPQVFFSGIIPLDGMAEWVQVLAKFMPIYYAGDALKEVMYKGNGFPEIGLDLLVLMIFAIVFITLNLFALKKYRHL